MPESQKDDVERMPTVVMPPLDPLDSIVVTMPQEVHQTVVNRGVGEREAVHLPLFLCCCQLGTQLTTRWAM